MLARSLKTAGLLIIITLLALPGTALGAGTDEGWTELDAGNQHWYAMEYTGHHEFEKARDENEEDKAIWISSNIDVRMDVEPDGGATFRVITPDQMAAWMAGEDLESCGCGTENDYDPYDLTWSGNFGEPGTYYLLVDYSGNGTDPVFYSLDISGQDVTSEPPPTEEAAAAESVEPAAGEAIEAVAAGGTGPADALAPDDAWVSLPAGGTLWYAFDYHGHHDFPKAKEDEDKPDPVWIASEATVSLDSEPDESVTFGIWSDEQVRLWLAGEEYTPIGQGTPSDYDPGDLNWSGSFGGPGRFYVVVENISSGPATFLLAIGGQDVTY
jgi:hypothetical protein